MESYKDQNLEKIFLSELERKIIKNIPTQNLLDIFGNETYLIGGAVRDFIFDKNPNDFDFMSRQSLEETIKKLNDLEYEECVKEKFQNKKYSIKIDKDSNNHVLKNGVINLFINDKEIQVGLIGERTLEELIILGDTNLSCCAFNLFTKKIINPKIAEEINNFFRSEEHTSELQSQR